MATDTSLVFNIIARDKATAIFNKVRASAESSGKAMALALAPAAGPLAAGAAAGIMSVAGAMASAGAAGKVYGAVYKSAFTEVQTEADKLDKTRDKIKLLGEQAKLAPDAKSRDSILKQQEKAARDLKAQLALIPPATRPVVTAYAGLKDTWKGFVDQNKPAVYRQMTTGMSLLQTIIPKLQPLFDVASAAVDRLLARMGKFVSGGGVERLVAWLTNGAGPAFANFERIGSNVFVTIGKIFGAFDTSGPGVLGFLADASDKMRQWAESGGAEKLVEFMQSTGPQTGQILLDIGRAVVTIGQAMAPFAPVSIAIAGAAARLVGAMPPGVITALVAAFIAFNAALKVHAAWVATTAARTAIATARQKAWTAATAAGKWVASAAALAAYNVKVVAVRAATMLATGAQLAWNGATAAAGWAAMAIRLAAIAAWQTAIATGTKLWTAAQWLLNVAMSMNPIGLAIIAIAALIAIIVLLWTKCAWFRDFWIAAWNIIKNAAAVAWNWIKAKALAFFNWAVGVARAHVNAMRNAWNTVKSAAGTAWNWISSKVSGVFNTLRNGANRVGSVLGNMWNGLRNGFRSAINLIVRGWNSLNFSIPGFSFAGVSVKGFSVGTPKLPYLAKGGDITRAGMAVVGERGPELVHLSKGAGVTPLNRRGAGRQRIEIDVRGEREIVALMRRLIRTANLLQEG